MRLISDSLHYVSTKIVPSKGESDDTSTGDSGFVDAREFRKGYPPTKVASSHHEYTPLNTEEREAASHYTLPSPKHKVELLVLVHCDHEISVRI